MKNHYDTLGIENFSDLKTVKKAFRQFARELHSDKYEYGSEEAEQAGKKLQKYTEAYNAIKTQELKDKYDRDLRLYLERHKPAASTVGGSQGSGTGQKAWSRAKPDQQPEPETTTAEPKPEPETRQQPQQEQAEEEMTREPEDPKTKMMREKVEKAYKWGDEGEPTIDVRM